MSVTNKDIRLNILNRLIREPEMVDYTIIKSGSEIIKRDALGKYSISIIDSYTSVDIRRDNELSLIVHPAFTRRFDLLEKWFEKCFCKQDKRDFKYRYSISWRPDCKSMEYRRGMYSVDFLRAKDTFEDDYQRLKTIILTQGFPFLKEVETLEGMYKMAIKPVMEGVQSFPDGFEWAPRYLALAKITHPEQYEIIKESHCCPLKVVDVVNS